MSRFLRMKKKLAGSAGGEKLLQQHMGFSGGRILRIVEATMANKKGAKAAKECRTGVLRFVTKADLMFQGGKLNTAMWTELEGPLYELCNLIAAATAPSHAVRRKYSNLKKFEEPPPHPDGKHRPSKLLTGSNDTGGPVESKSRPSTPTGAPAPKGLDRTASRRAMGKGGPPGMATEEAAPSAPSSTSRGSGLLPPTASTPTGGPPPNMFSGGPPGMASSGGESKEQPGAPPSSVGSGGGGGRKRPPLPSRPAKKDYTTDDVTAIAVVVAALVPLMMGILTKNDLMTSKNQNTLAQLIFSISNAAFLSELLTNSCLSNEKQMAYGVFSAYADQMKAVRDKRNEQLRVAAFAGDMNTIKLCLVNGADVNSRRDDNTTPLWFAAAKGQFDAVTLLLAQGADSCIADKDGALPVMLAAQEGHLEVVKLLVQPDTLGNVASTTTLSTLVYIAARKGYVDLLDFILQQHRQVLSVATPNASAGRAAPIELALTLAIQQGYEKGEEGGRGGKGVGVKETFHGWADFFFCSSCVRVVFFLCSCCVLLCSLPTFAATCLWSKCC